MDSNYFLPETSTSYQLQDCDFEDFKFKFPVFKISCNCINFIKLKKDSPIKRTKCKKRQDFSKYSQKLSQRLDVLLVN